MRERHIKVRVKQCELIASLSPCSRRRVGALIIDPRSNAVISEGYNGTPRGSARALCGGDRCMRTALQIESGQQNDVGCHHAEMNAILNAVRVGQSTYGGWLIVNCDPCLMCAKSIHHAGIVRVYSPSNRRGDHCDGLNYLIANNVALHPLPNG